VEMRGTCNLCGDGRMRKLATERFLTYTSIPQWV
jgi:hypothetical protein